MFVRKKKNRSGSVTIVVADKSYGRFREVHNFGASSDAHEIEKLEMEARKWISTYVGQPDLDLWPEERLLPQSEIISSIRDLRQYGTVQLLEQVYRSIGFESLGEEYNKFLIISKDIEVSIDMEKVIEDSKWDGWKGYITNTNINSKDIISQYNGL